jgi:hypothetical protein
MRDPADELATALGAPLRLPLAREAHEVLALALADRVAMVFEARSRKELG